MPGAVAQRVGRAVTQPVVAGRVFLRHRSAPIFDDAPTHFTRIGRGRPWGAAHRMVDASARAGPECRQRTGRTVMAEYVAPRHEAPPPAVTGRRLSYLTSHA
ncbi:hypothetical protein GCM10023094_13210 [Rhodococcus olei]|uniref:Uncharacterized protein n=1 Tax=Rhodococcus olei TaxID=2161675 RepID=A0ABP8NVW7_9NOCA